MKATVRVTFRVLFSEKTIAPSFYTILQNAYNIIPQVKIRLFFLLTNGDFWDKMQTDERRENVAIKTMKGEVKK